MKRNRENTAPVANPPPIIKGNERNDASNDAHDKISYKLPILINVSAIHKSTLRPKISSDLAATAMLIKLKLERNSYEDI